ncbi:hypothetical protein EJ06DRAFT_559654 [Trichodelitschia bisporula]|uniref:Uncharacterized protein n=1 Tax=Trichodelitschia bisporula TaxID=703511 RepID=A0A6G1HKY2_9PEZI|nr:hypothetical protein EJ06DRAFT_559654 [Trichodelitschia bisporula]
MSGTGNSNVGTAGIYESQEQRTFDNETIDSAERYKQGMPVSGSNAAKTMNPSVHDKLNRTAERYHPPSQADMDRESLQRDARAPAWSHGNEPSRGARIDQELREDDEKIMQGKPQEWGSTAWKK